MVSRQFHYTKRNVFMPFLMVEILNFQGSAHLRGVGSFSKLNSVFSEPDENKRKQMHEDLKYKQIVLLKYLWVQK